MGENHTAEYDIAKHERRRAYMRRYHIFIAGGYFFTALTLGAFKMTGYISSRWIFIAVYSITTVTISLVFLFMIQFKKRITNRYAMGITLVEFGLFLLFYPPMIFMLEEMRVMGLFFALMPLSFLLTSTNFRQSLVISLGATLIQVAVSYAAIVHLGQKGSFVRELIFTASFLPSAFYISFLAGEFSRRRGETGQAKRTAEKALSALWGEMALAKKIQTILLPEIVSVAGCALSASMRPAEEVVGDYYDIIRADNRDWIVIGDVSGHGVPAGLVMMMAQTSIRTILAKSPLMDPAELLAQVNAVLAENIRRMGDPRYMTATVFSSTGGGVFRFAGLHQDILVYRAAYGKVQAVKTDGMWLGLVDDIRGMLPVGTLILAPGDVMLLYTDGIVDSVDEGGAPYGGARLIETLEALGREGADAVRDGILRSLEAYRAADDATLLVIKRQSVPAR